jgi:hypothetical protein
VLTRVRRLPSPSLVISVIALVIAIAGGDYAIASLTGGKVKKIAKQQADKEIGKLGPRLSVSHATAADSATNATNLGGVPAASYARKPTCPSGMTQFGNTVCIDTQVRAQGTFAEALDTCAAPNLRLPTPSEAWLARQLVPAANAEFWTDDAWRENTSDFDVDVAAVLHSGGPAHDPILRVQAVSADVPIRCAVTPSG